jgi:thiol-disulfide isomerase/thioredoxin
VESYGGMMTAQWMVANCGRKCLSIWERTILIEPMKLALILFMSLLLGDVLRGAEVRLSDINGRTHQPLVVGGRKAVVLIFLSPFCPTANALTPEINRIASEYADRFAFYIIEADVEISATDAKKHAETLEIKAPVLLDPKQEMARLTKAKTTPEAVVLGSEGKTLYQGRINDLYATQTKKLKEPTSHDLRGALDAIAKEKPVLSPSTKAIGCSITLTP